RESGTSFLSSDEHCSDRTSAGRRISTVDRRCRLSARHGYPDRLERRGSTEAARALRKKRTALGGASIGLAAFFGSISGYARDPVAGGDSHFGRHVDLSAHIAASL